MPTYLVFKKVHSELASKFLNTLPRSLTILKKKKAKLKVALRRYLNTQLFYFAGEIVMLKIICGIVL
jgi:hypothetical protein